MPGPFGLIGGAIGIGARLGLRVGIRYGLKGVKATSRRWPVSRRLLQSDVSHLRKSYHAGRHERRWGLARGFYRGAKKAEKYRSRWEAYKRARRKYARRPYFIGRRSRRR